MIGTQTLLAAKILNIGYTYYSIIRSVLIKMIYLTQWKFAIY